MKSLSKIPDGKVSYTLADVGRKAKNPFETALKQGYVSSHHMILLVTVDTFLDAP